MRSTETGVGMSLRGVAEDLHGAERVAAVWYADSGGQLLTRRVVRMARAHAERD